MTEFQVVSAEEAGKMLAASELVLGVEVAGQARAYPLDMITGPTREFVNDTLGGLPITPAW